jgi:predicted dehydrogenase
MNAGYYPPDHWVHEAGGRIVGEACHIIDLMTFFTGSMVELASAESLMPKTDIIGRTDNKSIHLRYSDGSVCTIGYFAVGSSLFPKEYMEVHFDGKTIVMEDYRCLRYYGIKAKPMKSAKSQKGHFEEVVACAEAIFTKRWPIELWELIQTAEITLKLERNRWGLNTYGGIGGDSRSH